MIRSTVPSHEGQAAPSLRLRTSQSSGIKWNSAPRSTATARTACTLAASSAISASSEVADRLKRMKPAAVEDLVGVDVADTGEHRLVHQQRLESPATTPQRCLDLGEGCIERVRSEVMRVDPRFGRLGEPDPAETSGVVQDEMTAVGEVDDEAREPGHRRIGVDGDRRPGHPEVQNEPDARVVGLRVARGAGAVTAVGGRSVARTGCLEEVPLSVAMCAGERSPLECRAQPPLGYIAAHEGIARVNAGNRAAENVIGEIAPEYLDLGQLGHAVRTPCRTRGCRRGFSAGIHRALSNWGTRGRAGTTPNGRINHLGDST